MNLKEIFNQNGTGVIATSSLDGAVNTAIYARPHIIDENILAWGMTEGRTYQNVLENPHAAYLYMFTGKRYEGVRLGLRLNKIEDSGPLLEKIKAHTQEMVSKQAAFAVKHTAYFEITEMRPLI
jgi:hypothetical protein